MGNQTSRNCQTCNGTGYITENQNKEPQQCTQCKGTGKHTDQPKPKAAQRKHMMLD